MSVRDLGSTNFRPNLGEPLGQPSYTRNTLVPNLVSAILIVYSEQFAYLDRMFVVALPFHIVRVDQLRNF
jgi:hypothetical protein